MDAISEWIVKLAYNICFIQFPEFCIIDPSTPPPPPRVMLTLTFGEQHKKDISSSRLCEGLPIPPEKVMANDEMTFLITKSLEQFLEPGLVRGQRCSMNDGMIRCWVVESGLIETYDYLMPTSPLNNQRFNITSLVMLAGVLFISHLFSFFFKLLH